MMHDSTFPCLRRTAATCGFVALAILLSATSLAAVERLDATEAAAKIDELAREALGKGAVGLSVAVTYNGEPILSKGYGLAEVEHDIETDSESMFRIGSITKQFTAALVMQEVEAGNIGIDDDINQYVDFPTGDHTVTIRHLLTHTSGIKSYTNLGPAWRKTVPLEVTHEDLLGLVDHLPFEFAPDEKYAYNNTGYYLLGVILEKVTGKSYDTLILERIAQPLDLMRTRYGSNGDIIKNRAQGYRMEAGELKNDELIGMTQPGAAGALLSTAEDLLRWQRALTTGQVVSPKSYAQMTTPHELANGETVDYGFGLSITNHDGLQTIGHGGGINGFNSMISHYPEADVGIAVISNSEGYRAAQLAKLIARAVHGVVVEIADLPVPESEQKRLAGHYEFSEVPLEMTVRAKGEHLFVQITGQGENRILRQSEGTYRASFDDAVELEFSPGAPSPGLTLKQGGGTFEAKRKE